MNKFILLFSTFLFAVSLHAQDRLKVLYITNSANQTQGIEAGINTNIFDKLLVKQIDVEFVTGSELDALTDAEIEGYDVAIMSYNIDINTDLNIMEKPGNMLPLINFNFYTFRDRNTEQNHFFDHWDDVAFTGVEGFPGGDTLKLTVKDNNDIFCGSEIGDNIEWTSQLNDTLSNRPRVIHMSLQITDVDSIREHALPVASYNDANGETRHGIWKIPENGYVKNTVLWGMTGDYLQYATNDFYDILANAIKWCAGVDFCATSSVQSINNLTASVYPNPTNGNVRIELSEDSGGSVQVVSIDGKIIYQTQFNGNNHIFNIKKFASRGMYFVKVTSGEKEMVSKLIAK